MVQDEGLGWRSVFSVSRLIWAPPYGRSQVLASYQIQVFFYPPSIKEQHWRDQLESAEVNWIPMVALQHLVVPCTCCAVSLSPVLLGLGPQFATHLFTHLAFQHWSARSCKPNSKTNLWNHTCLPSCISRSLGLRKGSERTKELEPSFHVEPSAPTVLLKEVLKDPVK